MNNVKDVENIRGIIIYNDRPESGLRTIFVSNSSVPIVFISQEHGDQLSHLLLRGLSVQTIITKESRCQYLRSGIIKCIKYINSIRETEFSREERSITQWDIVCMSVALFLVASFSLVSFLFYYLKKLRRIHKVDQREQEVEMMARKAVSRMVLRKVSEEDSMVECSVCLDMMAVDSEVRELPCSHVYHRKCVDKWLIRKRKCPLCKLDILQHFRSSLQESES